MIRQCSLPLDPAAFPAPAHATAPLLNLSPPALLEALTADFYQNMARVHLTLRALERI